MADLAGDLIAWLKNFNKDDLVWVDDGGLALEGYSSKGKKRGEELEYLYTEVGGEPQEENEDE